MGDKFKIYSWVPVSDSNDDWESDYVYKLIYSGDSFLDAILTMFLEKKKGIKCVKLEWRGDSPFSEI